MARKITGLIPKLAALNWSFIGLMTLMMMIGAVVLFSAAEGSFSPWAYKQIIRFIILFPVMLMIAIVDIRFWLKYAYVIYAGVLALLVLVMVPPFSVTAMGATRWVQLGPITLQPSEFMKICLVFALARYFHYTSIADTHRVAYLVVPLMLIVLPSLLILVQPDLGTTLILIMVGGIIFFAAGVKIWKFMVVGLGALAAFPILWSRMHDYQQKRVLIFLEPDSDPLGAGYNILQSKIAIGSGGFTGKGFLHGTQSQLSFLPEKQTDFIFTMMSEEFGFVGSVGILILYGVVMMYGIRVAISSTHHFGRILAIGMISVFSLHVFVNVAMVTGLIPVVGAPLPFLSYGGTMLMTMMVAFGIILNVSLHKNESLSADIN